MQNCLERGCRRLVNSKVVVYVNLGHTPEMFVLPHALVLAVGHPENCVDFGGVVFNQLLDVLLHGQRVHFLEGLIRPVAKVLINKGRVQIDGLWLNAAATRWYSH